MHDRLWYPIGIGYIVGSLIENGYEVEVIDCIGDNLSRKQFRQRLEKVDTNLFGIGGLIMGFNNIVDISFMVRRMYPDSFIFAGNTCASTIPKILIENSCIDVCVLWEGEQTVVDLMDVVVKKQSLNNVKGITYNNNNNICFTQSQPVISNLDSLCLPSWDHIPMENYLVNTGRVYPISTVRGCPYHCNFCLHLFMNNHVRCRSAENIIDEMVIVNEKYDISEFIFMDDLFTVDKKMVTQFCKLKNHNSVVSDIPFYCSSRVNIIDEETIMLLKEAGCNKIGFGFESMSQDVLDWYNKRQTVKQIEETTKLMIKHDVMVKSSWLIGAANETNSSIKVSSDFCKEYNLIYNPHYVTPYPMTPLYNYAIENKLITDELEYIKLFSKIGNTNIITVNFTGFTDKELCDLKNNMIYFPKKNINLFSKLPNMVNVLIKQGLGNTINEFFKNIKPEIYQMENYNEWI